jgi:hypothetical protein
VEYEWATPAVEITNPPLGHYRHYARIGIFVKISIITFRSYIQHYLSYSRFITAMAAAAAISITPARCVGAAIAVDALDAVTVTTDTEDFEVEVVEGEVDVDAFVDVITIADGGDIDPKPPPPVEESRNDGPVVDATPFPVGVTSTANISGVVSQKKWVSCSSNNVKIPQYGEAVSVL